MASADRHELDQVTKAIEGVHFRWSARDTSISKLPPEERKKRLGSKYPFLLPEKTLTGSSGSLPVRLDWRNYNGGSYVTPVKEQGSCSACWAFAPTAALESNILISRNTPGIDLDLSEQTLISCGLSGSCDGGLTDSASDFIRGFGLPVESCYSYGAADGLCFNACTNWESDTYKINAWYKVKPTVEAMKSALYNLGPLVTMMAVQTDFYYYQSGVYSHSWGAFEGYHSAVIVGYDDAEQYFIVKSSWGADWGEAGYFRIAYGEINSETKFGFLTIAYETAFPAGFPTVDGVPRVEVNSLIEMGQDGNKNDLNTGRDNGPDNTGANQRDKGKISVSLSSVTGTVKDNSGNSVTGAAVQFGKYQATTDDNGQFSLSSIPADTYIVTVAKNGYDGLAVSLTLPSDQVIKKDFMIRLSSSTASEETGDDATTQKSRKRFLSKPGVRGPGWFDAAANPVGRNEAEAQFAKKRSQIATSKSGRSPMAKAAADISPEIQALARGLQNDPKLIYDYVHNNIDYVPYFGSLKGATLTLLDGSGNDFDQAALMIALLRASGLNAQYKHGELYYYGSDLVNWLGVSQSEAIWLIAGGGIPVWGYMDGSLLVMERVWVIATINGNQYDFDPAFKTYTYTNNINLGSALGYSRSGLMAAAASGATITNDYVQNLNETGIRGQLTTYATSLASAIRNQYSNSYVRDIISGRRIVQTIMTQYQASLPNEVDIMDTWSDNPQEYTVTIRIQHAGIDYTVQTPDLKGARLTITYAGADHHPELRLDGSLASIRHGNHARNKIQRCFDNRSSLCRTWRRVLRSSGDLPT
jgi:hypothetical protein